MLFSLQLLSLQPTVRRLEVQVHDVALVQEGQAARHIQRDGLAQPRFPLCAGATAPEQFAAHRITSHCRAMPMQVRMPPRSLPEVRHVTRRRPTAGSRRGGQSMNAPLVPQQAARGVAFKR